MTKTSDTLLTSIILASAIYLGIRHLQKDKQLARLSTLYDQQAPRKLSESGFSSQAIHSMAKTLKKAAQSYRASNMSPASNQGGGLHD